jgi:transposase-like protein
MVRNKEKIAEVRKLLMEGKTQEKVAEILDISARTIRRWKEKGYFDELGRGTAESTKTTVPDESIETFKTSSWPDITAADLVNAGFIPARVHIVMAALRIAERQENERLPRFLKAYIDLVKRWPNMPEAWLAALAGLPIVAEDIKAPSLGELMKHAVRLHPYITKETRREYHRVARKLNVRILAEAQRFLQDAAVAGGFPLIVWVESPRWMPWTKERSYRADDQLDKGRWSFLIPSRFKDMEFSKTWAGILFDIISRLPDPDKQRGKLHKKMQLTALLYLWCSTAPGDFKPPLPQVRSQEEEHYKGTLVEIYRQWTQSE